MGDHHRGIRVDGGVGGIGDAGSTEATYLSFDVDRDGTVYVAYDDGVTSLPDGKRGYVENNRATVAPDHPQAPLLRVDERDYSVGGVSLAGNTAVGAAGANAHDAVVVKPKPF